jgi:hypothetical protein
MFDRAGNANLRSLQRTIAAVAELSTLAGGVELSQEHVGLLAALFMELECGNLRPAEFYGVNPDMLAVLEVRKAGKAVDQKLSDQMSFFRKYFGQPGSFSYAFVPLLYEYIRAGFVDAKELGRQLKPESPVTELQELLTDVRERRWYYFGDAEYNAFIERVMGFLRSGSTAATAEVMELLVLLTLSAERAGVKVPADLDSILNRRLEENVRRRDRSFGTVDDMALGSSGVASVKQYMEDYNAKLASNLAGDLAKAFEDTIAKGDVKAFVAMTSGNARGLAVALTLLPSISKSWKTHRQFHYLVMSHLIDELWTYNDNIVPNINDLRSQCMDELTKAAASDDLDNSQRSRVRELIAKCKSWGAGA